MEIPCILIQNHICYYWLSVSGNPGIMYCGILINMTHSHSSWLPHVLMNIFWTLYIFSTHRSWAVTGSRRRWWSRTTADFSFPRGGCRGRSLCCGWRCRGGSRSSSCCGTATCKGCTAITTTCSWSVNTNIDKLHKFMELRASLTLFAKKYQTAEKLAILLLKEKIRQIFYFSVSNSLGTGNKISLALPNYLPGNASGCRYWQSFCQFLSLYNIAPDVFLKERLERRLCWTLIE